ncbi:MAG: PKD domain-containing protein [Candidatus Thorarchaeota archaeon]|jgi:PKD repeat protein
MGRRILVSLAFATLLVLGFPVTFAQAWDGSVNFSPFTVYQGETTQFTVTVNEERGDSTDIYWVSVNFCWMSSGSVYYFKDDDGNSVSMPAGGSRSFSKHIAVSQSALGSCNVKIKVEGKAVGDWWAETYTFTTSINIKSIPPLSVSASGNPNSGDASLTVHFSTSASGGLPPLSYKWTFGDGGTSTSKNPTHTYTSSGTYTATVTVKDSAGQMQTKSDTVTVHVTDPPDDPGDPGDPGNPGDPGDEGSFGGGDISSTLVLGLLLLVIVVVILIVALGRRKKPSQTVQPSPAQYQWQTQPSTTTKPDQQPPPPSE